VVFFLEIVYIPTPPIGGLARGPPNTGARSVSCNGDPLVDGHGGLGRMRGSMDVVDAEWLQGNEVAIVGLKRECIIFGIDEHYSISWIGFLNVTKP
jgi:hypothetical protein